MKQKPARILALLLVLLVVGMMSLPESVYALPEFQLPTGSIPTVTGTPTGAIATVRTDMGEPFLNVRSGPGALYEKIGVLLPGQSVPARGQSPKGEYILVEYPGVPGGVGWVSANYVVVTGGTPPVVELPPTITPAVTATFDPTLAAQFIVTIEPTRMPTFTEPAPIQVPTYSDAATNELVSGIPMGLVIVVLLVMGLMAGLISFFQSR
jgi:hypothetical protein